MKARETGYGFCPSCGKDSPIGTTMERRLNGDSTCGFCGKTTSSAKWLRVSLPAGFGSADDESKDRSKMS